MCCSHFAATQRSIPKNILKNKCMREWTWPSVLPFEPLWSEGPSSCPEVMSRDDVSAQKCILVGTLGKQLLYGNAQHMFYFSSVPVNLPNDLRATRQTMADHRFIFSSFYVFLFFPIFSRLYFQIYPL